MADTARPDRSATSPIVTSRSSNVPSAGPRHLQANLRFYGPADPLPVRSVPATGGSARRSLGRRRLLSLGPQLGLGGGQQKVSQVLHSQGDPVHFVEGVLFTAVHDPLLLPGKPPTKHVLCQELHGKWHEWGNSPEHLPGVAR